MNIKPLIKTTCLAAVICLLYVLSYKIILFQDNTSNQRYLLSSTTKSLLNAVDAPLQFNLYSKDIDLELKVNALTKRYNVLQPNIQYHWHKTNLPFDIQQKAPYASSALAVKYYDKIQVIDLSTASITEELLSRAIIKVLRQQNQWLGFVVGHEEDDIFNVKSTGFAKLKLALNNQGFNLHPIQLRQTKLIPDNVNILVILGSTEKFLPIEKELIKQYVANGKDLLWLIDPNTQPEDLLYDLFGVNIFSGIVIDAHGQSLGSPHPAISIIDNMGKQLPFATPNTVIALPWAAALDLSQVSNAWTPQQFLFTHPDSWVETTLAHNNQVSQQISFDEQTEVKGPLTLGVNLTREHPSIDNMQQRITIIGNSRFVRNGAIENYGNLALGLAVINWLNKDDVLANIAQPQTTDVLYNVNWSFYWLAKYGFRVVMPLLITIFILGFFSRRFSRSIN